MLQSTSLLRGKTANFTKKHLLLFYNLIYFHYTISYFLTADTNFGVICLLFLYFNGANPAWISCALGFRTAKFIPVHIVSLE